METEIIKEEVVTTPAPTLLPASKKISKTKTEGSGTPGSKDGTSNNCKKYETFNNSQKIRILTDLKKGLMQLNKMEFDEKDSFIEDILELLPNVELKEYNKLLSKVLTKHIDAFTPSPKILTQWRKKIKGWIHNNGKPENRGNPLVPFEKLENFRSEVIRILNHMQFRCFPKLRANILKVLERFHKAEQALGNNQPFNTNVCSKHWWFNFMQRNPDIKTMWEKIPLEREGKKLKTNSNNNWQEDETTVKEEEDKSEKDNALHMPDPIFTTNPQPFHHESLPTTLLPPLFPTLSSIDSSSYFKTLVLLASAAVANPEILRKAILGAAAAAAATVATVTPATPSTVTTAATSATSAVKEESNDVKIPPFCSTASKVEDVTASAKPNPEPELVIKNEEPKVKLEGDLPVPPVATATASTDASIDNPSL